MRYNRFIMTRDERQMLCVQNWLKSNGKGTIIAPTGLGKTRIATICIKAVLKKFPNLRVLVIVPTTNLKEQWESRLQDSKLNEFCEVLVINTAITKQLDTDLLILDEIHVTAANLFSGIFKCVRYRLILGLTATLERLDGRHSLIQRFCPVCDTITLSDTIINHWISDYTEYLVLLDVDNIDEYDRMQKEFMMHFEFFGFDWPLVMSFIGPKGFENRKAYTTQICTNSKSWNDILKQVSYHSAMFQKCLSGRKTFINNHSKKVEVARKIIEARQDSRIITFANNVKMAEAIGYGEVYTGKISKKRGNSILQDFIDGKTNIINSSKKLIAGFDAPNINCEIILGQDSSSIRATQQRGRALRVEGDKHSEIFNLVLNNTQELKWFIESHKDNNFIPIDEENLYKVLNNEPFEKYKYPLRNFNLRF